MQQSRFMKNWFTVLWSMIIFLLITSCDDKALSLKPVSYAEFEAFVNATDHITDAERFGWSIVQQDVTNYVISDSANWRFPDAENKVASPNLPVTQVSYNDALAYCKWAEKRLPTYDEYWELVKTDNRIIVSENMMPISDVEEVNIVGNVWDITELQSDGSVRLAGGSLFCSKNTCHGTVKERELYVDKETANVHIGFSVVEVE